jgi:hypothetical protein
MNIDLKTEEIIQSFSAEDLKERKILKNMDAVAAAPQKEWPTIKIGKKKRKR